MRVVVAFGALLSAASLACAADMPAAPPPQTYAPAPTPIYDWRGFYIGGNGGYGWASASGTDTYTGGTLGGLSTAGTTNVQGAVAGGQFGVNFQSGPAVWGLEGDGDWSWQKKALTANCGVSCSVTGTAEAKWLATARGRIGFALDRALIYATGGAAWLHASDTVNATVTGVNYNLLNSSSTDFGFAVGGGLEVGVFDNVSLKVEYLWLRFDNVNKTVALSPILGGTVTTNGRITDNLARAGINVRFPVGR